MRKLLLGLIGLLFAIPSFATCPTGQIEQTYTSATGTVTQNGTPTPTNPVEPIFYQQGDMILRKVGDIADSYDATTGKITRKIGVKIFNGTESLTMFNYDAYIKPDASNVAFLLDSNRTAASNGISNHLEYTRDSIWHKTGVPNKWTLNSGTQLHMNFANDVLGITDYTQETQNSVMGKAKAYLKSQFEAGTPYAFYYVLATPFEEDWNETTYCAPDIKIATTAYNTARFSPVVTELNDTIATIRSVVTNTINQTKAIADLQATKQTRPDENCPAGKKCLLVEDDAGQPHWYEIIENAYGLPNGYTALEYLQGKGSTHIVPGVTINSNLKIDIKYEILTPGWLLGGTTGESGRWGVTSSNTFFSGTSGVADISSATNLSGINTATFNYKTGATVNGVNIPFGTEQTYGNVTAKQFYLFSADGTGVSTQEHKIYYANIYNGETLVRSLVPAKRNSDNVLGLYDLANDVFYTNAGSGTFIAGPEI